MRNTLADLNNELFAQLERLTDEDLNQDELERELRRTDAVTDIAEAILHNGELTLKAMNLVAEYGLDMEKSFKLPPMLDGIKKA